MTRVSFSSLTHNLHATAQKATVNFSGAPQQPDRVTLSSASQVRFGLAQHRHSLLPQSDNGLVREAVGLLLDNLEQASLRRPLANVIPSARMAEIRDVLVDPDIAKPANAQQLEEALAELSVGLDRVKSKAAPVTRSRELVSALQDVLQSKKALLVPGLTAPKSSLHEINEYVEENLGYKAATIKLFPIATGLGLKNLAPLLGDYVDDYRILASRANARLFELLVDASDDSVATVRRMAGLEDSETGQKIAEAYLDAYRMLTPQLKDLKTPMVNTAAHTPGEAVANIQQALKGDGQQENPILDVAGRLSGAVKTYVESLQGIAVHQASRISGYEMPDVTGLLYVLTHRKQPAEKLSSYVSIARDSLADTITGILAEDGRVPKKQRPAIAQKLANRGIDLLFNRMIVMGHSMGGTAALKTMQQTGHDDHGHGDLDIGLSFCLGSPVNGVEMPPKSFEGLQTLLTGISPALREKVLDAARQVPAIRDMEAGSEAVQKMQSRTTPTDATTISITNPHDGLVHEEGAKLRTESDDPDNPDKYVNNHNFRVTPKNTPLANLVPNPLKGRGGRAQDAFNYLTSQGVLGVLNPMEMVRALRMMQGLEQHCTVIQHPDEHFAVDGEVMQQIFAEARKPDRLRRLLHENNYEPLREHVLDLITDRVSQDARLRRHYQRPELKAIFEEIAATPLPVEDGIDKKAARLLELLG